jgi:hypothetical protein
MIGKADHQDRKMVVRLDLEDARGERLTFVTS